MKYDRLLLVLQTGDPENKRSILPIKKDFDIHTEAQLTCDGFSVRLPEPPRQELNQA